MSKTANAPIVIPTPHVTLHGVRRGSGPLIVLLHGGPGCYDYLGESALAGWLVERFTVCAYDQRGCRHSTSAGPFTIAANVGDLEAVRRHLGAERISLLGHSAGAMLATFYAGEHPERLDRLILMSPAGLRSGWRPAFEAAIRSRLTSDQETQLATIDRRILGATDPAERASLYHQRFNVVLPCYVDPSHRDAAPSLEYYNREVSVETTASIQQGYDEGEMKRRLAPLVNRACVVHGRTDPIPWRVVDDYAAILPGAEVIPLDRCGHFPWLEEPEACRAALFAFFDKSV
jgi:proline iminopeptidase